MTDAPPEKKPEDKPDDSMTGDFVALGIGCLVTIIMLGAALYFGFSREG